MNPIRKQLQTLIADTIAFRDATIQCPSIDTDTVNTNIECLESALVEIDRETMIRTFNRKLPITVEIPADMVLIRQPHARQSTEQDDLIILNRNELRSFIDFLDTMEKET